MTDHAAGPTGPLAGIRIADFTRVLAGPYATMMLADFGADVIKIESPDGDETRHWLPPIDAQGESTYFGGVNRNKRSVVCDLTTAEGLSNATSLADSADVVIENFRPGVMKRFGLDFESLRERNPNVVYCSITGFGETASERMPGYDLLVQAVGGLMSITGPVDGEPSKVGVAVVDVLTGLNALAGILLGIRARDEALRAAPSSDQGARVDASQRVEVNLLGSLLSALTNQAAGTLATGIAPSRTGNAHPSIAPYELFHAADRPLVIAVGTDRQFRTLTRLLGSPELATDPRFLTNTLRVANRPALRELLSALLARGPAAQWVDAFTDAAVPAGLVNTIAEAFDFAESLGIEAVVELTDAHGTRRSRQVANPIQLAGHPVGYRLVPPRLNEHHDASWLSNSAPPAERQQ